MTGELEAGTGGDTTVDDSPVSYVVTHRTAYRYAVPVSDAYTMTCLLPRDRSIQRVLGAALDVRPEPNEYDERTDVFGNRVVQIGVHRRHDEFEVVATSRVEVRPQPVPSTPLTWHEVAERSAALQGARAIRVGPYRAATPSSMPATGGAELDELASEVFTPGRPIVESLRALSHLIFTEFSFDATATDWATPLDDVLRHRRGVCQDFAHLAIAACRSRGLAAAYVSGYIETDPPPGEVKSIGADASHAWCAVWIPGVSEAGDVGREWFDLDPTNDQVPPYRHITLGWGRDYSDVAPVRGVVIGPSSTQTMEVSVDVRRIE